MTDPGRTDHPHDEEPGREPAEGGELPDAGPGADRVEPQGTPSEEGNYDPGS